MNSYVCITGSCGVLGRTFAKQCAERGWSLLLTDMDEHNLDKLTAELSDAYTVDIKYFPCDLTNDIQRDGLYQSLETAGVKIWMVINVAGLDHEGKFMDRPRNQLREIIKINIESTTETIHACIGMRDGAKPFRIITVASLAGYYSMPYKATYAASKSFLIFLTRAIGEELRPAGGSSTVLCPAGLRTRPDAIKAIEAQGIWGKLTTVETEQVVKSTLNAALKGRAVVIPGRINRILHKVSLCIPPGLKTKAIHRKWMLAHAKKKKLQCLDILHTGQVRKEAELVKL